MESLSSKFLLSLNHPKFLTKFSINPLRTRTLGANFKYFRLIIRSKKSTYQVGVSLNRRRVSALDFQEYVKPSRLLPAEEVKVFTDASVEKNIPSSPSNRSESLYKVKLQTSKMYGSGLSDVNSGILLCLIDENGSSILQRLPAASVGDDSEDKDTYDILHFQRGSVDEFAFEGPNLGRIAAVWISLESGQWRIAGMNVSVFSHCEPPSSESKQLSGLQYNFELEDILLGEKTGASMMEFRPNSVTTFSEDESTSLDQDSLNASNEESMKEYADLKFSLLFYDSALILVGSSFASLLIGENASYAFLTGGFCGFFYLLLLQRSVDELPAQELVPSEKEGHFGQILGKLKGPISSIAVAFVFAFVTVKFVSGEDAVKLAPKDVLFGMMGFLMCKVSVVLAAFKPVPLSLRDNKQGL